jgi:hypothetical protein
MTYRVDAFKEWALICRLWCDYPINDDCRDSYTYTDFLAKFGIIPIYENSMIRFYEFESEKHYLTFKIKYDTN